MAFETVKEVIPEQVMEWLKAGEKLKIVEVLQPDSYNAMHIKAEWEGGSQEAENIPEDQILGMDDARLEQTFGPKDSKIIIYCLDEACMASPRTCEYLQDEKGYTNVYDLAAGKHGWKAAGLPIVEHKQKVTLGDAQAGSGTGEPEAS